MLKRYLVFTGDDYYPAGGWDDFVEAYDTVEDAKTGVTLAAGLWAHIVDRDSKTVLLRWKPACTGEGMFTGLPKLPEGWFDGPELDKRDKAFDDAHRAWQRSVKGRQ